MAYITVQDIREEGITVEEASDSRIQSQIDYWTQFVDDICGQFFEERTAKFTFRGSGYSILFLPVPPIEITSIKINNRLENLNNFEISKDLNNPCIFHKTGVFPFHVPIDVEGKFGYLINGKTPEQIKRAMKKLVISTIAPISEQEQFSAGQILSESTDGHKITYMRPYRYKVTKLAGMVVDVEVKEILEHFKRTPIMEPIGREYAFAPITTSDQN